MVFGETIMPGRSAREGKKGNHKETPLVVWLWMLGLGLLSYLVARIALYTSPHPYHWASGAAGAVVGYLTGWLWYTWKGDVI